MTFRSLCMMRSKWFAVCFTLALLCATFTSCADDNDTLIHPSPSADLEQRMGKGELFDILKTIPNISQIEAVRKQYCHSAAFDEEYQFYIEQLIDPKNPSVGTFKQKARIGHRGFDKPMVLVTEGYALGDKDSAAICGAGVAFEQEVDTTQYVYQGNEIMQYIDGNMLVVEHRYFYTSNPDVRDWSHLTVQNASSDLHNIFKTLKPLYKKPWVSTGVSKGGMTTMFYHMMYPNDVDICVPYCAPMCYGVADDRAYDYIKEMAADSTLRRKIVECKNWLLKYMSDPENMSILCDEYRDQWDTYEEDSVILTDFLTNIISFDVDMFNYGNNWAFDIMPTKKPEYQTPEWIVNWLAKIYLTLIQKYSLNFVDYHYIIIDPVHFLTQTQTRATYYDINKNTNLVDKNLPYFYMAFQELGYSLYTGIDDLEIPDVFKTIIENLCKPKTIDDLFAIKGFDNKDYPTYTTRIYDQCIDYYQNHDDRIVFIYGANDFWTGCGINDVWKDKRSDRKKYPTFNFENKRQMACYIVPGHGHESLIANLPKDKRQEVWTKIEKWLAEAEQR